MQETISLARVRTVTLRELDGMAGVIPALYLPNNYTRDVASVSFTGLVTAAQAAGLGRRPHRDPRQAMTIIAFPGHADAIAFPGHGLAWLPSRVAPVDWRSVARSSEMVHQ